MVLRHVDAQFDSLGEILKTPSDQLRMVMCLIFAFSFGFGFKKVKNPTVRHALSVGLGAFCQYFIYRLEALYPLVMVLFVYYTLKFFGRNHATKIMVACMSYLSIFQIYRMYIDWGANNIDVTVVLMIYTCKCTSFAWCYHDGSVDKDKLSKHQLRHRILELPSLLEYFSFLYFFGNSLVGPACEYNDHNDFINLRGDYEKPVTSISPSFGYLIGAFMNMGIVVILFPSYNAEFTTTQEYADWNIVWKMLYVTLAMQVQRCKYYTAWLLGTASVTSAGLNYDPKGKNVLEKFRKIIAVRPLTVELEDNVKNKIEAWNTPSQLWLKNYVYFRIVNEQEARNNPGKAARASNITFMTSAFWHGFYPGYYLGFFWMFLAQQTAKSIYRIRDKLTWIPEPIAFGLRWSLCLCAINLMGNTFVLLDPYKIWAFYKAVHFIPVIALVGFYIVFNHTAIGKKPKVPVVAKMANTHTKLVAF